MIQIIFFCSYDFLCIYIDNKVSVQKQEKKPTYAKLEIKLGHIFIFNE